MTLNQSRITGKERDTETGLDNFGARYFASNMGRFISPDPLLNSGRPDNPQTWHRYAYTLNNPLTFVDPFGLYAWAPSNCKQGDTACQQQYQQDQQAFRDSLAAIQQAQQGLQPGSEEYNRVQQVLDAYGTENDGNNVFIGFGATPTIQGEAGETSTFAKDGSLTVTLDPSKFPHDQKGNIDAMSLSFLVGHEGTHVLDQKSPLTTVLSPFAKEYRATQTSSFIGQGLFRQTTQPNLYGPSGTMIWNPSWAKQDIQTFRDKGVTTDVVQHYGYKETLPHDPLRGNQ